MLVASNSSNYKRIHHWHERISQLLITESPIPDEEFIQIAAKLLEGGFTVINKDVIRTILRSLNMQLYIEKWLQIIFRITMIMPPIPGSSLIRQLDELFLELQEPFECYRANGRKNFLNYNYVFCRLFQKMGCTQYCMFFPLIKSQAKVRALDDMWTKMATSIKWQTPSLKQVQPFAVRLERSLLSKLQQDLQDVHANLAGPRRAPLQMGYHKSDLQFRIAKRDRREISRLHSDRLARQFRIPSWAKTLLYSEDQAVSLSCFPSQHQPQCV